MPSDIHLWKELSPWPSAMSMVERNQRFGNHL